MKNTACFVLQLALLGGLSPLMVQAEDRPDLRAAFQQPPPSARPWVYWFPLDGNITSNGITADLEAMRRVGIGGVLYMETDQGAPKGPARFGDPQWRALFQHICAEASRLGLEVNMHNNAGWTGSGGPWITPELSMQRLVWAQTNVAGTARFDAVLPQPKAVKEYYRDIAVFAYPAPAAPYAIPQLAGKTASEREELPLRAAFPALAAEAVVPRGRIADLTAKLGKDGRLAWDVPAGTWTLLRVGHTTTGKDNHPAPLEGRGLECDKLSKAAVEVHYRALMGQLVDDNKALAGEGRALVATHIDSWEVGSQNWTPEFRKEFRHLRGYDPLPLLPVMSGLVVDSLEVSERFLWDMRQTISDLLVENYAGHFRKLAHRDGLRLSIEPYNHAPCDDLAYAGCADEPMAEFWSWPRFDFAWSCTEMASAAHVYGRPVLGAEAFTANNDEKWLGHPALVKSLGDWALCEGVNRFVFHRYALQPWTQPDRAPGMGMGPWGLHYERTQTWWEQSKAWHAYLARCQVLLQQGLFVADLCFLEPESSPQRFASPVKSGYGRPGYNFDGCPPEVVLSRMKVKDGRLVLPDGMSYSMLVLPQVETMSPRLLKKIRDLVKAGATVLGAPPVRAPGLQDYPRCDEEVRALAREVWGGGEAPAALTPRALGKGQVIWGRELQKRSEPPYENVSALRPAKWIWFNEGRPASAAPPEKRFFRRVVKVDAASPVESAQLVMTGDNTFECAINGTRVAEGFRSNYGYTKNVTQWLRPGDNLLTVIGNNAFVRPNPAGLIGALKIVYRDGHTQEVLTDRTWEVSRSVSDTWLVDATSKEGWSAALELGPAGMAPWGAIEEGAPPVDSTLDITVASRVLAQRGVPPDFQSSASLNYIHKRLGEADVYFLANPEPREVDVRCTFRVSGRQPELWWPDTGRTEEASAYEIKDGCTSLPLRLDPSGSLFVVFRKPRTEDGGRRTASNFQNLNPVQEITGPWEVTFDPKWGGPGKAEVGDQRAEDDKEGTVVFETLTDWSAHADPRIRYYSGTASYRKTFDVPSSALGPRPSLFLDLGKVAVMAEVKLNGKELGILWKPPYRVDITGAVKAGENTLEVKVVNLWINRQIGDEQLPEDSDRNANGTLKEWPAWLNEGKPSPSGRVTFASWRIWKKDDALVESGLLGPVRLLAD